MTPLDVLELQVYDACNDLDIVAAVRYSVICALVDGKITMEELENIPFYCYRDSE
jgi:hypothetical protein